MLHMDRNPLKGLQKDRKAAIRGRIVDCLPLQCNPKREMDMYVGADDDQETEREES
jgi:hypothetical protein